MNKYLKFLVVFCFCFIVYSNKSFAYTINTDESLIFSNGVIVNGIKLNNESAIWLRNKADHSINYLYVFSNDYFVSLHNVDNSFWITRQGEMDNYYLNGSGTYFNGSNGDFGFSNSHSNSMGLNSNSYEVVGYTGTFINRFNTEVVNGSYYYVDTGITFLSWNNSSEDINGFKLSNGWTLNNLPRTDFIILEDTTTILDNLNHYFIYPWLPNYKSVLVYDEVSDSSFYTFAYEINHKYYVGNNVFYPTMRNDILKSFTYFGDLGNPTYAIGYGFKTSDYKLLFNSLNIYGSLLTGQTINYDDLVLYEVRIDYDLSFITNNVNFNDDNILYDDDNLFSNIKNFFIGLFWPSQDELTQLKTLINNNPLLINIYNVFNSLFNIPVTQHFYIDFDGYMGLQVVDLTGFLFTKLTGNVLAYIKTFCNLLITIATIFRSYKIIKGGLV